jgi:amino acid transporter
MANELKRHLSWFDAASIVVGIVIGAGIFVTPQDLSRHVPSPSLMMLAWGVSGFLVFCGALAFAELSSMLPATGGIYIYLRQAFGPAVAFSSGWVHLFALFSGATAYIASGFASYCGALLPVDPALKTPLALGLVFAVAIIGSISTRTAVMLQNITNFAKLAALLLLISLAFFAPAAPSSPPVDVPISAFAAALATCFFCYEGWSYAGFVAGEMRNPARDLPRCFAVSFLFVLALYLMVNLAYLHVLTIPQIQASSQAGADVAIRVLGPLGGKLLAVTILLAIIGAVNGLSIAASRMYYAQAKDGLLLPGLDYIHPRLGTPVAAIAAQALTTAFYIVASSSLGFVLQLAITAAWLYYAIAVVGLMRLRHTAPALDRPYRMWGYPVTPVLFILGTCGFLLALAQGTSLPALTLVTIIAVSFPIYRLIGKSKIHGSSAQVAR